MATTKRIIPPVIHKDGSVHYHSTTSKPDDSIAACGMVPNRIIPVIFVPGVMGSNLMTTSGPDTGESVWVMNGGATGKLGAGWDWAGANAKDRKKKLNPQMTGVYREGNLPAGAAPHSVFQTHPVPTPEDIKAELIRRGWGEVAHMSYGPWLMWLEETLNDSDYTKTGLAHSKSQVRTRLMKERVAQVAGIDPLSFDEVALSYRYQFPVHAVGYNWLQSNADSAKRLQEKIEGFMAYYRKLHYMCDKVILVTHSMGGLVARYYTEILSKDDKDPEKCAPVLGVVHGVMPTIGSATAYKRVKAGSDGDWGPSHVMGNTAAKVTAVFAQSPGPLQLLPSKEYGNGWLKIKEAPQFDAQFRATKGEQFTSYPIDGDPYGDIYTVRNKWWGLINDKLINPIDEKKLTVDKDWDAFVGLIKWNVKTFHTRIANEYHPHTYVFYGDDKAHSTWGDVVWEGKAISSLYRPAHLTQPQDLQVRRDSGQGEQDLTNGNLKSPLFANFTLKPANENGDGTVPIRSGSAPTGQVNVCIPFPGVDHEGAYKNEPQQLFALWAIVKIAQNVKDTCLDYAYITERKA